MKNLTPIMISSGTAIALGDLLNITKYFNTEFALIKYLDDHGLAKELKSDLSVSEVFAN